MLLADLRHEVFEVIHVFMSRKRLENIERVSKSSQREILVTGFERFNDIPKARLQAESINSGTSKEMSRNPPSSSLSGICSFDAERLPSCKDAFAHRRMLNVIFAIIRRIRDNDLDERHHAFFRIRIWGNPIDLSFSAIGSRAKSTCISWTSDVFHVSLDFAISRCFPISPLDFRADDVAQSLFCHEP